MRRNVAAVVFIVSATYVFRFVGMVHALTGQHYAGTASSPGGITFSVAYLASVALAVVLALGAVAVAVRENRRARDEHRNRR